MVMQNLQDCCKTKRYVVQFRSRVVIVRFSAVVVRNAAFLRQPCNKAQLSCGSLAAFVRQMCGWRTIKPVVRALQLSCGSLECLPAVLHPPEIAHNCKENEHVEAFVFEQPCDLVFHKSCGVAHNTVRLPHEPQKFVVADMCMAAARL